MYSLLHLAASSTHERVRVCVCAYERERKRWVDVVCYPHLPSNPLAVELHYPYTVQKIGI